MKMSNEILSLRGRFGGVYFKHDNAGQHIQSMPRGIHRAQFGSRSLYNRIFSECLYRWKALLLTVMAVFWYEFAKREFFTKKDGIKVRLPPGYWFNHYNVKRIYLEENVWYYPPNHVNETPPYYSAGKAFGEYGNPLYPAGEYNGKTKYKFGVGPLFLWWDGSMWWVSSWPGYTPPNYCWFRPSPDIDGTYIPINPLDEGIFITE
jgi:hypothetical protein